MSQRTLWADFDCPITYVHSEGNYGTYIPIITNEGIHYQYTHKIRRTAPDMETAFYLNTHPDPLFFPENAFGGSSKNVNTFFNADEELWWRDSKEYSRDD